MIILTTIEVIITMTFVVSLIEVFILVPFCEFDLSIFNPIRNYNEWDNFNWFGIGIITLLLNIIFIPFAICYWIYKIIMLIVSIIYWVITVGRY